MDNLLTQRIMDAQSVFGRRYLNTQSLYLFNFNKIASVYYIGNLDGLKAYALFKERYKEEILSEHQFRCYDKKRKEFEFDETIFIMKNHCLVEFNQGYMEILHDGSQDAFLQECTVLANKAKKRKKRKPLQIELIVTGSGGLYLKAMDINRTKLNLDLFYEDDFKAVDAVIQNRLNKEKGKGIVLLHGLPGTGKTTYLRYLIGKLKKRVLFISANVARELTNPDFIDLLIDNPNTVVIIEDAEQIIMDRRTSAGSAVSGLLNISDGLMADFLNVQLICTFNSSLITVDSALLRKGRLIAKYEFGKLSVMKAQILSDHLGFDTIINKPMTIAEIAHQKEAVNTTREVEVIGFKF